MPDPCNAKEYCQSKIITHQPKSFENPKIFDIKSVIIEHQIHPITYPRL